MEREIWSALILTVACVGLGWGIAIIATRFTRGHNSKRRFPSGDALAFVGGAFGIVLGLLLLFASQHFSDAREAARQEAVSVSALYDTLNPFPEQQRTELRHDVYCTLLALQTDDWKAGELHDVSGSENTHAWLATVQRATELLPQDADATASMHYFVNDNLLSLGKDRDLRLQLGLPEIPASIWWLIFFSTVIFIFLLALHMGPTRKITAVSIAATTLLLCVITATLAGLDNPYRGSIGTLSPVALETVTKTIQDSYPNEDFSPCPQLAEPVYENVL